MEIIYITFESEKKSPVGVKNKINQTMHALKKVGYSVNTLFGKNNFFTTMYSTLNYLIRTKCQLVIIRNHTTRVPFILPVLLYLRYIKKIKIIIDVPSPVTNAIDEIKDSKLILVKKYMSIIFTYITYPISLYPAHRVLEYSYENQYFSFGLKKNIKLIGNGISTEEIPYRIQKTFLNNELVFIGIAHLAFWHGYDRLIKAIHAYNITNPKIKASFYIIGEGDVKNDLEQLTYTLDAMEYIFFEGKKEGDELNRYFEMSHIAVCSLGLYRKNLVLASELKVREYATRGIPFILGCQDFDVCSNLPFVYKAANNNSFLDIKQIVEWYKKLDAEYKDFELIRDFAENNLDFNVKVQTDILSVLEEYKS